MNIKLYDTAAIGVPEREKGRIIFEEIITKFFQV